MTNQAKGLLITIVAVLFVVPDALFIRLIDANSLTITFWRNGLCGCVIFLVMLIKHKGALITQIQMAGFGGMVYALCAAFSSLLFVVSVGLTTVANTVFIISAMPIFAAIYSWLIMGEKVSKRMLWTIGLVILGLMIIGYGSINADRSNILGDLAAVGVAAIFALGLTMARRGRAVSMVPIAAIAYIGCAIALLPFTDPFDVAPDDWIFVLMHGGVFIAISTALLAIGPRYITSAEVALIILLESVLAPILVWFALGEEPNHFALIGGAIVIGVLFISNLIVLMRKKPKMTKTKTRRRHATR